MKLQRDTLKRQKMIGETEFSDGVVSDWTEELVGIMFGNKSFIENKVPKLQVKL